MSQPILEHGHSREQIRTRLAGGPRTSYVRDLVFGGIDGAVTTFAIAAGAVGADLSARIVLILGAANLLADGFSMAAANYSSTRTEMEEYAHVRAMEARHIEVTPEGEREEVRQILSAKGFDGDGLDHAVGVITADRDRWIDTMMADEHGLQPVTRSPLRSAGSTFAAFVVCGSVPLLPFIFGLPASTATSTAMTAVTFFGIGSLRSRWSPLPWWRAGLNTTAIGLAAASVAYLVGHLLSRL